MAAKYRILKTAEFAADFEALEKAEKERVENFLMQLSEKGSSVGKPLSGLPFFREKKFNGKRLYYLVYENYFVVLAVAISDKKAQQAVINNAMVNLLNYKKYVDEIVRK
ncbi:MAG: hypothetical protein AABW99_05215 [archaeon]